MKNNYYATEEFMTQLNKQSKFVTKATISALNDFVRVKELGIEKKGLNFEKIDAEKGFYSIRVNKSYRIILYRRKKDFLFVFLWVDNHDSAYNWAESHYFNYEEEDLRPFRLSALEQKKPVAEIETSYEYKYFIPERVCPKERKYLFENLNEEILLNYGIPKEMIANVLLVTTHNEFVDLGKVIPQPSYLHLRNYLINYSRALNAQGASVYNKDL